MSCPRSRGSCATGWTYRSYSENALSSTLSISHSLIAILLRDYGSAFLYMPLLNFIYSMIGLLICKYEPFWQEISVESLILRWLLRPVGLFVISQEKYMGTCLFLQSKYIKRLKAIRVTQESSEFFSAHEVGQTVRLFEFVERIYLSIIPF